MPQTLTPEQEHYEFPPRSRFLKKLATSTAERRRISVLQDHVVPSAPTSAADHPTPTPSYNTLAPPPPPTTTTTTTISTDMRQPDQLALNEWFSKKIKTNKSNSKPNKDRAVIDWMNDVERSSTKTLLPNKHLIMSPTPSSCHSHKIQFKSDAGKRWANSITSNTSLFPPDETCRKHYVPRRLLIFTKKDDNAIQHDSTAIETAATKIQDIWKEYQNKSTPLVLENKVGKVAMATTGQRTPIAGMVHLLQRLNQSFEQRQLHQKNRIAEIETVLKDEVKKRQQAEERMKRLESVYQQQQQIPHENNKGHEKYQTLLSKVTELELCVKRESHSRKVLQEQLLKATASAPPPVVSSNSSLKSKRTPLVPATASAAASPIINRTRIKSSLRDRTSSLANVGLKSTKPSSSSAAASATTSRRSTLVRSSNIKK